MRWHSRITSFKPYEYIDEMISGPFKKWKHLHKFHDINGKQKTTTMTEVIDEVEFELLLTIDFTLMVGGSYLTIMRLCCMLFYSDRLNFSIGIVVLLLALSIFILSNRLHSILK
jgi:ligand-binding SRPBCC domain-containing protein